MPSGYTYIIEDGDPTFKEFALRCARAFVADMRDEGLEAPLKEVKEEPYYVEQLNKAKAKLAELQKKSKEAWSAECFEFNRKALANWYEAEEHRKVIVAKYEAMMEQVMAWKPPTEKHQNLKRFMANQILESVEFVAEPTEKPVPEEVEEYKAARLSWAEKDVVYYTEKCQKQKVRVDGSNDWIKQLKESL